MNYSFTTRTYSETGVCIRLSAQDAKEPVQALQFAIHRDFPTESFLAIGGILQSFLSFITPNANKLVRNGDGTISLVVLPHALQIGNTKAFDPNPLFPAYTMVKQALIPWNASLYATERLENTYARIPMGTQSVAKNFHYQAASPIEESKESQQHGLATVLHVYQCFFPGAKVPMYSTHVADFISFILAETNKLCLSSNFKEIPTPSVHNGSSPTMLTSQEVQATLQDLKKNFTKYQNICSQVGSRWRDVAESFTSNKPKWPVSHQVRAI